MIMMSLLPIEKVSCKVSLFITSVASDVRRIFFELLLFLVLLLVVMVVLLLLVVPPSVSSENLIFSLPHILFSSYESRLFLCAFFSDLVEMDQLPSYTNSLNEWIPWSREVIQGSDHSIYFCYIFFNGFKFFLDLSNPFEVGLYILWVLYLQIL